MSNRADSRQHGLHRIERIRPSSKLRVKLRKAKTRIGQKSRQEAIAAARAEFLVVA